MEVKTVTDLSSEPVTLAAMKNFIKTSYATDATEDAEINALIKAARIQCEKYNNRSLGAKTLQMFWHYDEVMCNRLVLPYGPHETVSDFYKIDQEGNETALTENTDYFLRGNEFLEVELNIWTGSHPYSDGGVMDYDYRLNVTAGYGTSGLEALPEAYVLAIKKLVREAYLINQSQEMLMTHEVITILEMIGKNVYI